MGGFRTKQQVVTVGPEGSLIPDNQVGFRLRSVDGKPYLILDTTDDAEEIILYQDTYVQDADLYLQANVDDNKGRSLLFKKSRDPAPDGSDDVIVEDNDVLGQIIFEGADGDSFTRGAAIIARVDGTPGADTDMPTELVFATTPDDAGTAVERMVISPTGAVKMTGPGGTTGFAIPATNTALLLENHTGGSATKCQLDINSGGSAGAQIRLFTAGTEYAGIVSTATNLTLKTERNNDPIVLAPHGSGGVGVNQTVPEGNLHITTSAVDEAPSSNADEIVLENNGSHCGMTILANSTYNSQICFGDEDDSMTGVVAYTHSNDELTLRTFNDARDIVFKAGNDRESFRIEATGPHAKGVLNTSLTSGTVSTSGSSTTLTGSSTVFTTDFHVGAAIKVGTVTTTVTAIASNTELTLEDAINTSSTGTTCKRDGGELFAVKTGDSKSLFSVNETGAIGCGSAAGTAYASNNIAIGDDDALDAITTGVSNVIVGGSNATYQLTTGSRNIFVGYRAGEDCTDTNDSVIIGEIAGCVGGAGDNQVLIGRGAGTSSANDNNVAVGYQAMYDCSGHSNVAVGYQSLDATSSALRHTAVGFQSLSAVGSGAIESNTALGSTSGATLTTGQQCLFLGAQADTTDIDGNNQIAIGFNADTDGPNKIRLGNASIATCNIQVDWTVDSDERIKENVQDADAGLDFINALRPVSFTRKHPAEWPEEIREKRYKQGLEEVDDEGNTTFSSTLTYNVDAQQPIKDEFDDTSRVDGLIAQEVKAAVESLGVDFNGFHEAVNGKMGVQYATLVVPLIKAVQQLSKKVEALENGD